MKPLLRILLAHAIACGVAIPAGAQQADTEFFESKIRPLLATQCYACHTRSKLGGLRVDSRAALLEGGEHGPAIVAGDAEASLLILAVRQTDPSLAMPKSADKLSDAQIADLVQWIDRDAPWPVAVDVADAAAGAQHDDTGIEDGYIISDQQRAWWAFQPLGRPTAPLEDGAATDIDRFVMATPRRRRPRAVGASQPPPSASPSDLRSHRSASDTRGDRGLRSRHVTRCLRDGHRPPPGLTALRRALGAALARRRTLRRGRHTRPGRGRHRCRALSDGVHLPRLGDRGVQRRHALRPLRQGSARRRPAARSGAQGAIGGSRFSGRRSLVLRHGQPAGGPCRRAPRPRRRDDPRLPPPHRRLCALS